MTVSYTPGQLRSATSLAPETYRHWKKVLNSLRREKGHSPCFTYGDLIAVSVLQHLCNDFSIRIGALAPVGTRLFTLFNSTPLPALERGKVIIDLKDSMIEFQPESTGYIRDGIAIIIPLRPIAARLREQLLAIGEENRQSSLPFPLQDVAPSPPRIKGARS